MVQAHPRLAENPDGELQRRVTNFLAGRHMPGLRKLTVEVADGTVTLFGRVASYYEKQLGVHCCQRVAGVMRVVDRVDVS